MTSQSQKLSTEDMEEVAKGATDPQLIRGRDDQ